MPPSQNINKAKPLIINELPINDENKKKKRPSQQNSGTPKRKKLPSNSSTILQGMVLAVSTFQKNNASTIDAKPIDAVSYQTVADQCLALGATVSNQVHKKVVCVICSSAAVQQGTQRVRKAYKKGIPIVNVAWLNACKKQAQRLDFDEYIASYNPPAAASPDENNVEFVEGKKNCVPNAGWTKAISYGCSCVCHENGDKNCLWCHDCNAIESLPQQRNFKEKQK